MTGLELTMGDWLVVCAVGTVVGLDGVSWPQAMWSRPIAAGTLGGLLFGAAGAGFLAGAWLEVLASRHPPFGGARYPETGPAALVAGAAYGLSDSRSLGALLCAVLVGWTLGWIGMHSIAWLRTLNARLVASPDTRAAGALDVEGRHRTALRLDALRAAMLTGALFVPSVLAVRWSETFAPGPSGTTLATALSAMGLAGLVGTGARALGGRRGRWPVLVTGMGAGILLAWWLG